MKAQYNDPEKYSVKLPDGSVVPRLFEYDWKRLGIDKLEAKGDIAPYVKEPEMPPMLPIELSEE